MKKGLIINYKDVAAMLAHEDDKVQAEFFSVFAQELRAACETEYHTGLQMAFVVGHLDEKDAETLFINKEES